MVCLTEIRNPFDPMNSRVTTMGESGKKLVEYLPSYYGDVVVALDGVIVQKYDMTLHGDHQIIVSPVIQGGGGGKNILRSIAFVALAIGAPYAAGAIIGSAGGALAGATAYYGVTAAVMAGGALLINAVLPMQTPTLGQIGSSSTSPVYGWSGTKTLPTPGAPIPVLYGQMRLPGSVIGQYVKDEGDDEYLYTLLALCEGPIEPISMQDIYINNNPLDTCDNVEYAYRVGDLEQKNSGYRPQLRGESFYDTRTISWFNNVSTANPFSAEVQKDNPVTKQTLGNIVDSITVSISMPKGLYYANDQGGLDERTVSFKVEYSADGTNWTVFQRVVPEHSDTEYEWYRYGYYYTRETQWSATSPGAEWSKTGRSRQTVVSTQYFDEWEITAAQASVIRRQYTITGLTPGSYSVRVTKITDDKDETREKNVLYWGGMTEIVSDRLYYPGIALLAIKIKATGQLSGTAPSISTLVRRSDIEIFDEAGTSQGTKRSDNPAWVAWDVITSRKYGMMKPYSSALFAKFSDFAEWCDQLVPDGFGNQEPRARFNGVLDFQSNIWETLQKICSAGRAAPVMSGTKYSVIVDKPADPVQLFSMGNIVKGSYKTSYIGRHDVATEIDIEYLDENAGYAKNAITVSLEKNTGEKTSVTAIGTTSQSQAYRSARYMLQCNDKQRRLVTFEAGIDSIACQPGDVILFAHDVPAWGYSGRVVSGTTSSVTLDRSIDIDANKSYRIVVRHADDTIEEVDISNPESGDTFSANFQTSPSEYEVYTFGELNKEYIPLRVASITRKSDQTRKITAIDYNASILDDWTTPENISRPSHITGFAEIADISVGEHLEKRKDGTIVPFIDFSWRVKDDRIAVVDLLVQNGESWNEVQTGIRAGEYRMNAMQIEEGKPYTFALVVSDPSGRQPIASAAKTTHIYLGKSAPPDDVIGLGYSIKSNGVLISWKSNNDLDLYGYNLYVDDVIVAEKIQSTNYLIADIPTGSHDISIEAIDTTGNVSENRTITTIDISPAVITQVTAEVIDNNVLLRWSASAGTVAIDSYHIKKDGEIIGSAKTTFSAIFEANAGSYLYSIVPVDVFGNEGIGKSVNAKVSQPPDYVLHANWYSDFGGTLVNAMSEDGIWAPVNTAQTWQSHFDDNSWTTPQDQISAGYPVYIEPLEASGSYEETFDYGAVLKSTRVTVNSTFDTLLGSPVESCTISLSEDGSTWEDHTNTYQVFGTSFRYVKVKIEYAGDGDDLAKMTQLNVRLDSKLKSDAGTVQCSASDASGTSALFNNDFVDVTSITVTPNSTSQVTAVYDFQDVPHPTGFSIYLYDASGNRIDGEASWQARGY